jgi:hypothetical protein
MSGRKDSAAFADELAVGLEVAGLAPFLESLDRAPQVMGR